MKPKLFLLIGAALTLAASLAQGAIYLKVEGIDGAVTAEGFDRVIQIHSWSFGVTQAGSFAQPTLDHFTCSSAVSKASPKLMLAVADGKVFPQVVLHVLIETENSAGKVKCYLRYHLERVTFSGYRIDGLAAAGAQGAFPIESYSLNFEEVKVSYVSEDGTSVTGGAQFPAR